MFAFVDHFEPVVKPGQDPARKAGALADWTRRYPELAAGHRDSDGRPPRHTWTFPLETYDPRILDRLVELCRQDLGEIEVHLHHDGDTADTLRPKILDGLERFARHGVATIDGIDGYRFAFVHGNWCLDNSRADGRWCGVNDELILLRQLGCFADVTYPAAPDSSQTRKINAIYYATDDPARPKSHDTGVDVEVGREPTGDLMIIQGPLLPDWSDRRLGIVPRIDNASITGAYPGTPRRVDGWVWLGIGVRGRPEWVFVKVHCHGATVSDREACLGAGADRMFRHLETAYGAGGYRLHYVTAREMYNVIKAAEAGESGDPNAYRDFRIPPYACISGVGGGNVSK
ncbi:MAG: hypothetical protein ACOC8E_05005, partial [Planctomycetota bacterium]